MTLELMNLALHKQGFVIDEGAVTQIPVFGDVIQQVEIILST